MRTSIFASLALVASFALAGCAVDSNEPQTEQTDDTQQAAIGDNHLKNAVESDNNYVVHAKPQLNANEENRIYDYSSVPRVGARAPYDIDIQEVLSNVAQERAARPSRAFGVSQESHLGVGTH